MRLFRPSLALFTLKLTATPTAASPCQPGIDAAEYWIFNTNELASLQTLYPTDTTHGLNLKITFSLAQPGVTRPRPQTNPVAYYKNYTQFKHDISLGNVIPKNTKYVAYDNENWIYTPDYEKVDPIGYEQKFAELAHEHGYNIILTPSQNLLPGFTTPSKNSWQQYICQLAAGTAKAASRPGDIYEIQAQAYEEEQFRGDGFFLKAVRDAVGVARAANPEVVIFAGISTSRVRNANEIYEDWVSVNRELGGEVDGFWLNITGDNATEVAIAAEFLARIPAAADSSAPICPL